MTLRRAIPLPAFTNVVAGSTATLDLPVDRRYHHIMLEYRQGAGGTLATEAQILAQVEEIRININGVTQRKFTPAKLFSMLKTEGYAPGAGFIPIYFSEPWRRTTSGEDNLAWNMNGNASTFQIEVDLAPAAATPKLGGYQSTDQVAGPLQGIKRFTNMTVPIVAVGDYTLTQLPLDGAYQRIHCFETAVADITRVKILAGEVAIYDMTRDQQREHVKEQGGTPQDGVFQILFDPTRRLPDVLPTVTAAGRVNLRLDFTMANANPFDLLAEVIGTPDL